MPVPVFDEIVNKKNLEKDNKNNAPKIIKTTSGVAVFITIFLVVVSIFTAELFLRDVNKNFNNEYSDCYKNGGVERLFQKSAVSADCDLQRYEEIRLLIHIDVMIPIVITGFILIFVFRKKISFSYFKVLRNGFSVFIFWLSFRMLGETEYYLVKHEPIAGKYVVLLTIIIFLVFLVVMIQKKFVKK